MTFIKLLLSVVQNVNVTWSVGKQYYFITKSLIIHKMVLRYHYSAEYERKISSVVGCIKRKILARSVIWTVDTIDRSIKN